MDLFAYLEPKGMLSRPRSIEWVASNIGVSTATIRNWVKAGHLVPTGSRPLLFDQGDVERLRDSIKSGGVMRLRSRANKSTSSTKSVPLEYAINDRAVAITGAISEWFEGNKETLDIPTVLFLISMRLLELHGEIARDSHEHNGFLHEFHSWKRKSVKQEMHDWHAMLRHVRYDHIYAELCTIIQIRTDEDLLGLVYQSLSQEGDKSTKGSYYTPRAVVERSLQQDVGSISTFLDPCCGSGQYLLCAARAFRLPLAGLIGFDIDKLAVRIARINLLIAFPDTDLAPKVECVNTITELATGDVFCPTNHLLDSVDFIATNPPWGAYKNTQLSACQTNGVRSNEAFSLILAKSIALLRNGGRLSFILPESILNIRTHADIREIVLIETQISQISHLGRQFSGVFTPVIRLDLIKGVGRDRVLTIIKSLEHTHCVDQNRFRANKDFSFDVNVTESEDDLITRIYERDYITLKGNADWALGIVTGNNKEFVSPEPKKAMEAIYKGSDVCRFSMKEPSSYINFVPEKFQQVAKIGLYRAPVKLIYKFISNKLIFAYDDEQRLTLNSANIIIPRLPGISIKVALALLNSNILQYIFMKRFSTHKVLRGDLETLPIPRIEEECSMSIESFVNEIIGGKDRRRELNQIIYALYGASTEDVVRIERALGGSWQD